MWGDRSGARRLIEKAQAAGYRALLVTVDVEVRSKRERELRAGVNLPTPSLTLRTIGEAGLHPAWWWHFLTGEPLTFPNLADERVGRLGEATVRFSELFDGTLCWDDLAWIRDTWDGPVALKGVLSVDDARHAASLGVDAVVVSNHGGRQLDHVPATIDVLPGIVDAVGDQLEVLFDSGIRRGTDIAVALALGARAVLIGRAYLYGLAAAGEPGVAHTIDILAAELRTAMALAGVATLGELDRSALRFSTSVSPHHVGVGGKDQR